jgi:hypothetical protein
MDAMSRNSVLGGKILAALAGLALSQAAYAAQYFVSSFSLIDDCAGSASDSSGLLYGELTASSSKLRSVNCSGGGYAIDTAKGWANMGSLGGFASSSRSGTSGMYDASAQVATQFYDVITFVPGPSAHQGDPVDIVFNLDLDGGFTNFSGPLFRGNVSFSLTINSGTPLYQEYSLDASSHGVPYPYPGNTPLPWVYHTTVGKNENTLGVLAKLSVMSQATDNSIITVDYGSTAHLYADIGANAPAGTTLISSSGHDYSLAAAVPEPAQFALLVPGLALILLRRRSA